MSSTGVFVFLGPTMPVADARQVLDAEYLPPVMMGDVVRLVERGPATIAIIDGLFEQTPAVWHKEILYALEAGVRVLGASSMGALRAAELHTFGMEGVGEIFEAFRDGMLEDDDEVAVAHLPASQGFRSVSDAMVNLREGVKQARRKGLISAQTGERLIHLAKEIYYPERNWRTLVAAGRSAGLPGGELDELARFAADARPDLKRSDAVQLLQRLAAEPPGAPAALAPSFDFEPSCFWEVMRAVELADDQLGAVAGALDPPASAADLRRHLRFRYGGDEKVMSDALLFALLSQEAARDATLVEAGRMGAWAEALAAAIPPRLVPSMARLVAAGEALVARRRIQIEPFVPLVLAQRGLLASTLEGLACKQRALSARGVERPSLADAGLTVDELLTWHSETGGRPVETLEELAGTRGFNSTQELLEELLIELFAHRTSK